MIRRPPRSTQSRSSAASDVYKRQPITLIPGGSYFDSATSFGMIRSGHVNATCLGKMLAGMGGTMDLVTGAKTVYIVSEHCANDGSSKPQKQRTNPPTGAAHTD